MLLAERLIWTPSVYLVGTSTVTDALNEFLRDEACETWETDATTDTEAVPEVAGRICYMSFGNPRPGGNRAYLQHILASGHGSVTEHATYNLVLTGVSRTLTHELIRHRSGCSYSELSQRFVDGSACKFVVPPRYIPSVRAALEYTQGALGAGDLEVPPAARQGLHWLHTIAESQGHYQGLLAVDPDLKDGATTAAKKAAREAARSVLPGCTETKLMVTMNARAARNFLEQRGHAAADQEMQRLAKIVLPVLQSATPNLFADYTVTADGITTPYRKV